MFAIFKTLIFFQDPAFSSRYTWWPTMHGTPLLPPKGEYDVYMTEEDNQGHNLHHHQQSKGNRNRDPPPRTTGFVLERDITPEEGMPEKRDKKKSIGETGWKQKKINIFYHSMFFALLLWGFIKRFQNLRKKYKEKDDLKLNKLYICFWEA